MVLDCFTFCSLALYILHPLPRSSSLAFENLMLSSCVCGLRE